VTVDVNLLMGRRENMRAMSGSEKKEYMESRMRNRNTRGENYEEESIEGKEKRAKGKGRRDKKLIGEERRLKSEETGAVQQTRRRKKSSTQETEGKGTGTATIKATTSRTGTIRGLSYEKRRKEGDKRGSKPLG